ncbi:MAG: hypothetical protein WC744_00205 [Patescibacteria group bacterium]|jgi:hypothetical protein
MVEARKLVKNAQEVLVTMTVHCSYGCGASFVGKYRPGSRSEKQIISKSLQSDKITHEIGCEMNPINVRNPI